MWRWLSLGVRFFNHILFDLLLPLLPPVCWSVRDGVRDVSIRAQAQKKSEQCAPFMCAQTCGFHVRALTFSPSDVSSACEWPWCLWESAGV